MFINNKNLYKQILGIALPISLQSLISFGINIMDTIMVGKLGETKLSAASLSSQIFFIITILCFGIGGGGAILASQFNGKKHKESISKTLSIVIKLNTLIGILFLFLSLIIPSKLLMFYTDNINVIMEGIPYLKLVSLMYPLFCITVSISIILRTVSKIKISVISNIVAFLLNMIFNWILIFGKLGFPALGLRGAAIGTIISRTIECIIMIIYLFFIDKKINFTFKDLIIFDREIFKKYIQTGINVLISDAILVVGLTGITIILGKFGYEMIAANSICSILIQLSTVLTSGIGNAALVIIGNTIGEGNIEDAKKKANTFLIISIIVGIVSGLGSLIFKGILIDSYNVSYETKIIANKLINGAAIIMIFKVPTIVITKGILRGGGDTKFLLFIDIVFLWILSIPLGLFSLRFKLPVTIMYLFLKSDEIAKFICCIVRMNSNKWIKDITVI